MKRVFFVLVALAPALAHGQSINDLVRIWLAQAGKTATPGDYSTCQPEGQADDVCGWNVAKLGAQPTADQLQALVPTWQNQQVAKANAAAAQAGCEAAIAGGLTITDPNGHCPACVGVWLIDAGAQADITATATSIQQDGVLPNGQDSMPWFDAKGLAHTFDIPSAKLFATAVKEYVASLKLTKGALSIGAQATWPAPAKAIP